MRQRVSCVRSRGNLDKREAQDHQVSAMGPVDMLETTLGPSALGNKDGIMDEPAVLPSCGPRITLTWKGQTNMERSRLLFFLTMMKIRFLRIPLILRFPLAISLLNCSETHMAV